MVNLVKAVYTAIVATLTSPTLRPAEMAILRAVAVAVLAALGYHEVK